MSKTLSPLLAYMLEVRILLQRARAEECEGTQETYAWFIEQGYSPDQAASALIFAHKRNQKPEPGPTLNQYAQELFDIGVEETAAKISYDKKMMILRKRLETLQSQCPHQHTSPHQETIPGDYYSRAETVHTITCEDCGKELGTRTEVHNYYG